ncbi:MAG: DUF1566 domain-containing protein [Bacteroidetes bacterium]|nr:DUF1566 domain-containing protein [Bacteroidota bacterium]
MKKNICICIILSFIVVVSCRKDAAVLSTSTGEADLALVKHYIGEHFGGGVIFYLNQTGKHGLIAATLDIEEASVWSRKDTLNNAKGTALGAGAGNSYRIVKTQGYPEYEEDTYAALECMEFMLNGYQDWFLPSKDELNELYKQQNIVGNFKPFSYWSSSELDVSTAWFQNFGNGQQLLQVKTAAYALRPVRRF